ncbi:MAG TPA: NUDIX domain-containing protein [Ktedonobacterales bacterium]|nr:NUDIX domain-containing protein [Ktedonobacterales bacterium]
MTTPPPSPADRAQATTDNPDEVFDLVDEQDRVIGRVRRGDAHHNRALIHRSVQVMVFDSAGRALLQRRSARKDLFPGYYCASASGHVISGDDYTTTAQRELAEELGVSAALTILGTALVRSEIETEMTALFIAQSDGPFHFDPVETAGGEFLAWDDLLAARATLPMTPALLVALEEIEQRMASGALTLPR